MHPRSSKVTDWVKNFDLFPKLVSDERARTSKGAALTLGTCAVLLLLILSETASFLSLHTVEHVSVDPSYSQKLRIVFNVTFHALRCGQVQLDAMDVAGMQQEPSEHEIWKQRLTSDPELRPLGPAFRAYLPWEQQQLDRAAQEKEVAPGTCGDCYGAITPKFKCCNTCADLKEAYMEVGWSAASVAKTAKQCQSEAGSGRNVPGHDPKEAGEAGEACRVSGFMLVNKVAGNLNVALGEIFVESTRHIHQFNPGDVVTYNVTHTVHTLSFGPAVPGLENPLEGKLQIRPEGAGLYQYFIKLVPTTVVTAPSVYWIGAANDIETALQAAGGVDPAVSVLGIQDDDSIDLPPNVQVAKTNQYSVTMSWRPAVVNGHREAILPGVFFIYDLSPFMVTVTQRRGEGILTFLTGLCAIAGGLLAMSELVDRLLHKFPAITKLFDKTPTSPSFASSLSRDKGLLGR